MVKEAKGIGKSCEHFFIGRSYASVARTTRHSAAANCVAEIVSDSKKKRRLLLVEFAEGFLLVQGVGSAMFLKEFAVGHDDSEGRLRAKTTRSARSRGIDCGRTGGWWRAMGRACQTACR